MKDSTKNQTQQDSAQLPATFSPVENLPTVAPSVPSSEITSTEAVRVTAEVQAMMVMAKRFPRDQHAAYEAIIQACRRRSLAERAMYAYRRGSQLVTGPSIRLAEVIAQAWGNVYTGVKEVAQEDGESKMVAFAWDLQTNFRDVREFVAKHERDTRQGKNVLTDSRDIYELGANLAARRKRACILAVIPGDIVEAAVEQCKQTIAAGDGKEPLADRMRKLLVAFKDCGVTQEMVELRLGHKLEALHPAEFVQLYQVYTSIRDGMAKREDFFSLAPGEAAQSSSAAALEQKVAAAAKPKQ